MIRAARIVAGLGVVAATVHAGAVVRIDLGGTGELPSEILDTQEASLLERLFLQLGEYGQGKRQAFSVAWRLEGMTPFTLEVLEACALVPWGETVTYGELAHRIGNPGAVRAVGTALGRNPLPILIPCHRVLSGSGIGGFSGGMEWKRRLLGVEGL